MTSEAPSRPRAAAGAAFWTLLAATVALGLTMVVWGTMRFDAAGAGRVLDLRPGGYDVSELTRTWTALGAEGRDFYLNVLHRLDMAFPALLGASCFATIGVLLPRRLGAVRWLIAAAVALPATFLDYAENIALDRLMRAGPQAFTEAAVSGASRLTRIKSAAIGAAGGVCLVLGIARLAAGRRRA